MLSSLTYVNRSSLAREIFWVRSCAYYLLANIIINIHVYCSTVLLSSDCYPLAEDFLRSTGSNW